MEKIKPFILFIKGRILNLFVFVWKKLNCNGGTEESGPERCDWSDSQIIFYGSEGLIKLIEPSKGEVSGSPSLYEPAVSY